MEKKCKYCDSECLESGTPKTRLFSIPFTKIDIMILNYSKTEYLDTCLDCYLESQKEPETDAYHAGKQDGYQEAIEDNRFNL